ncbi:MAG: hypothetical protein GQ474_03900 [Sulfurimonas sp.]|nr:hypothetical protein [Sulfurimonas sp.]
MKYTLQILFISILFITIPINAFALDWEGYADKIVKKGSPEEEKLKKAKKKAKDQEDKFTKILDKEFKDSFKKVFNGKISPSETYKLLQVIEAASAGDYKVAGEEAAGALLGRFVPLVGTYITIMKATSAVIKDQIETWSEEVYYSQPYKMAKRIFMKESKKYPSYVPSYIMTYTRNNKVIGKEMEVVWQSMKKREEWMYSVWVSDYEHDIDMFLYDHLSGVKSITDILNRGWASRMRAIKGKDLQYRHLFNHFLHHFASEKKRYYFEELQYEYIEPLMQKAIKKQEKAIELATAQAIENTLQKMQQLKEVKKEEEPKKKKVVFFSSGGDETAFRQEMQREQSNNTLGDNQRANQSYAVESQKHIQERVGFRQDMQELAGSLQEVQNAMIIAQAQEAENKAIARDNRFEARKEAFRQSNQAKYDARMSKYNTKSIPQSGNTSRSKQVYKPVGTVSSKPIPKQVNKPKQIKPKPAKKEIICGYDVSYGSQWKHKDGSHYIHIFSKEKKYGSQKKYYYLNLKTCALESSRIYIGNEIFEEKNYKNGKLKDSEKELYSKQGKKLCHIEFKFFHKNGKLKSHAKNIYAPETMLNSKLVFLKKWDNTGKLIYNENNK